MSIIVPQSNNKDKKTIHYSLANSKNLLLIFTRNPVLGQCKTRLAATVGDNVALDIYKFLLHHTFAITNELPIRKQVYYSNEIWEDDIWDSRIFEKHLQSGSDLGERMAYAFRKGFENGFENIIIIGSDMYDLDMTDLEVAFNALQQNDFVIGPAEDGGYYLLGMKMFNESVFKNKNWGSDTVFQSTMNDLKNEKVYLLKSKNDIDLYEDVKHIEAFQPYLKNI
ncbi:MAG: TIGR04282 family arsenosugar biosynthesis glycosyltransferase [Maribacter sp.]